MGRLIFDDMLEQVGRTRLGACNTVDVIIDMDKSHEYMNEFQFYLFLNTHLAIEVC